ncbi:SRPBCC family protein [Nocardia rhamnosiphila]
MSRIGFTTRGTVDAPVDRLWAIVGDFAGVMKWHPTMNACVVDGSGVGARRTVELGGRKVVERLDERDDERHIIAYSIVMGRPLSVGVSGRISLAAVSDGETSVEWVTTIPNRPGADELAAELAAYYKTRIENMREAVAPQREKGRP